VKLPLESVAPFAVNGAPVGGASDRVSDALTIGFPTNDTSCPVTVNVFAAGVEDPEAGVDDPEPPVGAVASGKCFRTKAEPVD
jgi:hypothetical protein